MKAIFRYAVTSTMDWARECFAQQESAVLEPFVVMCRLQTEGRGRGGSRWSQNSVADNLNSKSDGAHSVHLSFAEAVRTARGLGPCTFVFPASFVKIPLSWMTLSVGCALYDALERVRRRLENQLEFAKIIPRQSLCEPRIKWPNDLWAWPISRTEGSVHEGKKIAGVLCESSFRGTQLQYVTIGIGLNITDAPAEIKHAGSVLDLWGIERKSLPVQLIERLEHMLAEEIEKEIEDYLSTERSAAQLKILALERALPLGTRLSVNKGAYTGEYLGLSDDGGLLLQGRLEPLMSGDVGFASDEDLLMTGDRSAERKLKASRVCIDFGNSHIHWRCEVDEKVFRGACAWAEFDKKILQDDRLFARTAFFQSLMECLQGSRHIELVWAAVSHSSAANRVLSGLENALTHNSPGREIALCPLQSDEILQACGLLADYAGEQLGVDRALQAWVAAREAQRTASVVCVVSFGTALTGLTVAPEGRILESFILPGAAMSLAALHEKTARLPKVSLPPRLPECKEEPPFSTQQSMLRGIVLQSLGLLLSAAKLHGVERFIFTGGGARSHVEPLTQYLKTSFQIEDDLVLQAMSDYVEQQKLSRFRLNSDQNESQIGLPEKVLQSMLRARLSKRRSQRVALERCHFRRLGGRLEHVGVGLRLDRHLGERFKFHTREIWQERVDIGEVMIEQNSPKNHTTDEIPQTLINIKSTYTLKHGDQIWLFHPPEYEPDMATHVEVVHDDGDAAVFCKPGNLVVHAAGLYGKNTFIEIVKKMGFANVAPVHRIDRETSGLLVCARSTPLRRELSLSFRDASVKKMYLAVTRGNRAVPEQFKMNFPIGNAVNSRIRLKLWHNPNEGLDALTHCVRLARWEDYTLFACLPQTGRTNQIRVHLAAIGHWIVGDKMYHPEEDVFLKFYEEGYTDFVAQKVLLPRHWLHNTGIQFLNQSDSPLGRGPVIAPLTEDLLVHPPTIELLKSAGFPLDPLQQTPAFAKLFHELMSIDFSAAEEVGPEVS